MGPTFHYLKQTQALLGGTCWCELETYTTACSVCALLGKVGYKVANNSEVSPATSEDDTDGPCMCCPMTKLCKCGIEADVRESNDNYRRRYMRCPKRVSPIKLLLTGTLESSLTVFDVVHLKFYFVGRRSM